MHFESEEEELDETSDFEVVNVEEEMVYFPPERSSCFVHTLQLVVRDAMDDAGSIKKLVSFCHKSTLATDALEGGQKLQPANATRWNSQLKMLRSVLNVPSDVLAELNCPIQLTSYELKIIQELCEVLEPFEEATDRCQAEKMVTSSFIIPCVRGLRHAIKNMKMTANKKFVSTLQSTLDPRFKLDWCIGEEQVIIKNLLTAKVESASPKRNATMNGSAQPKKCPKLFFLLGKSIICHAS